MDGISQKLKARAILLEQGNLKIAVVSLEMLTVPMSLTEEVEKRISDENLKLLLVATHTHHAPDSQMFNKRMNMKIPGIASFNSRWLNWYAEKIAVLLQKEMRTIGPVQIEVATEKANLSRFRSFQNTPQQHPRNRVISIQLKSNQESIEIMNYAAHPTILGHQFNKTHGDWPGEWMTQKPYRILLQGALGDISPLPPDGKNELQRVKALVNALNSIKFRYEQHLPTLQIAQSTIQLPSPTPHPEFVQKYATQESIAKLLIRSFAPKEASLTLVKLGNLILVFIPGEPTEHVGLQIEALCKTKFPDAIILPISFANDWIGYILTEEQYQKGGYEATLSFYGQKTKEIILQLVESATKQLTSRAKTKTVQGASNRQNSFRRQF